MKLLLLPLALFAIGCVPAPTPGTADAPAGACNAAALANLVGRPYSEALAADARRRSGARAVRRIRPGDAVTMDYRGDRLNIHLDGADRVERFACG